MTTPTTPPSDTSKLANDKPSVRSDAQPTSENPQRISNFVHVHQKCYKCGGCIHECEHRVKTTLTTTGGATEYYDALGNHIGTKALSEHSTPQGENKHKTPSEPNNTDVAISRIIELVDPSKTTDNPDGNPFLPGGISKDEAKAAIKALLVEARISEVENVEWNDAHLYVHNRLAALRKETPDE